jgi:hypothetical protein
MVNEIERVLMSLGQGSGSAACHSTWGTSCQKVAIRSLGNPAEIVRSPLRAVALDGSPRLQSRNLTRHV